MRNARMPRVIMLWLGVETSQEWDFRWRLLRSLGYGGGRPLVLSTAGNAGRIADPPESPVRCGDVERPVDLHACVLNVAMVRPGHGSGPQVGCGALPTAAVAVPRRTGRMAS